MTDAEHIKELEEKISSLESRLSWVVPTFRVLSAMAFFIAAIQISQMIIRFLV